jgi:hypothetical protein
MSAVGANYVRLESIAALSDAIDATSQALT